MVLIPVLCPHCQSDQVIKGSKTKTGKQRYKCQSSDCRHDSFLLDPAYTGRLPEIKQQVINMSLNFRSGRAEPGLLRRRGRDRAAAPVPGAAQHHMPLGHVVLRSRSTACRQCIADGYQCQ